MSRAARAHVFQEVQGGGGAAGGGAHWSRPADGGGARSLPARPRAPALFPAPATPAPALAALAALRSSLAVRGERRKRGPGTGLRALKGGRRLPSTPRQAGPDFASSPIFKARVRGHLLREAFGDTTSPRRFPFLIPTAFSNHSRRLPSSLWIGPSRERIWPQSPSSTLRDRHHHRHSSWLLISPTCTAHLCGRLRIDPPALFRPYSHAEVGPTPQASVLALSVGLACSPALHFQLRSNWIVTSLVTT
nr:probable ribonuclease ZC3H12D [Gorilla gorilla gorilla]